MYSILELYVMFLAKIADSKHFRIKKEQLNIIVHKNSRVSNHKIMEHKIKPNQTDKLPDGCACKL